MSRMPKKPKSHYPAYAEEEDPSPLEGAESNFHPYHSINFQGAPAVNSLSQYNFLSQAATATMGLHPYEFSSHLHPSSSMIQPESMEPPELVPLPGYSGIYEEEEEEPLCLAPHRDREEEPMPGTSYGQPPKNKKRVQKCRLCANHRIDQVVKGHRLHCQ